MNIWGELIKGTIGQIPEFFTRRAEIKAQIRQLESQERIKMHEIKMAQLDRQTELHREGLAADANWELEFVKQAASSWKDEYTLVMISVPVVMCFIPGLQPYVREGFNVLKEAVPVWYQTIFASLFLATVGIRLWRRNQYDTENPLDALTSSLRNRQLSSTTGSVNGSDLRGPQTSGPSGA